jgi:hypothetical protein
MSAADMMLQLAYSAEKKRRPQIQQQQDNNSDISIDDILNHVFMLLLQAKDILMKIVPNDSTKSEEEIINLKNMTSLCSHPSSLINDLKSCLGNAHFYTVCQSDPTCFFREGATSITDAVEHVFILLAAVMTRLRNKKIHTQSPLSILMWALSHCTTPSYDLIWHISQFYLSSGMNRLDEAVSLMEQCIGATYRHSEREECRSEWSAWLGLSMSVYRHRALPALRCAHACLFGLGSPARAIDVSLQGLRELSGTVGGRISEMLADKLKAADDNSEGTHAGSSIISFSYMWSLGSEAINIFHLLLMIARSYACWSRCTISSSSTTRRKRRLKSYLVFQILESSELRDIFHNLPVKADDRNDESFTDIFFISSRREAVLLFVYEYCILLAELGNIKTSIQRLELILNEENNFATFGNNNEKEVEWEGKLSHHLHLLSILLWTYQNKDKQNVAIDTCKKAIRMTKSTKNPILLANKQLTLAKMFWEKSLFNDSIHLIDEIINSLTSNNSNSDDNNNDILTSNPFPSSHEYYIQQELLKVAILLECSKVCRFALRSEVSQRCVEEVWLILYSPKPFIKNNESSESSAYITEAASINICREIPTLRGWRLPTGMGWGITENSPSRMRYVVFEAEVLAECADILLLRNDNNSDDNNKISDILLLALSISPNHSRSKLRLANLILDIIESEDPVKRDTAKILQAHQYAQEALLDDSSDPTDAW